MSIGQNIAKGAVAFGHGIAIFIFVVIIIISLALIAASFNEYSSSKVRTSQVNGKVGDANAISYTVNGESYSIHSDRTLQTGQNILVYYDPKKPGNGSVDAPNNPWGTIIVCAILSFLAGLNLFLAYKYEFWAAGLAFRFFVG